MNKYVSPLRYPGGKLKVVDFIKQLFEVNNLHGGTYIEPYAGGASVALSLLFSNCAHTIRINDIDRSIYAFWYTVLYETEELCRMINDTKVNMEVWDRQRAVQNNKANENLLELGFSTFFLNRTNRSGILSAGVIGGKTQDGPYKMDARYNKKDLIGRIEKIAKYRDRIEITNIDAKHLIESIDSTNPKTICYLDPPYYIKGQDLYLNYYNDTNHMEIAQAIKKYDGLWIISYDAVSFIKTLYGEFRKTEYNLSYSAGNPTKGKEIMIYSDRLIIPDCDIVKNKMK